MIKSNISMSIVLISLLAGGRLSASDSFHFSIYNENTKEFKFTDQDKAKLRHSPCSTFKIPHAFFALNSKVRTGLNDERKYDPVKNPKKKFWPKSWVEDHDLESAIQNSVVWYFQEIAREIGKPRMQSYINKIAYGNQDISAPIDQFWLSSSLKISAKEQLEVMSRLFSQKDAFQQSTRKAVQKAILWNTEYSKSIYAKTGTCKQENSQYGFWLVGFIETKKGKVYFSSYLEGSDFRSKSTLRKERTIQGLKDFGVLE